MGCFGMGADDYIYVPVSGADDGYGVLFLLLWHFFLDICLCYLDKINCRYPVKLLVCVDSMYIYIRMWNYDVFVLDRGMSQRRHLDVTF